LEVQGSKITAVWDRRPETPSDLPVHSSLEIDKHNLKEAAGFLNFLRYYIKDVFSIGSIVNDRIAASKMLQMKIAREVGFSTPCTCFSNRKDDIVNFASGFESVVLKSIENDSVWNENDGLEYVFYAKKVKSSDILYVPDEAFSQTVSFVQNYIEKNFELRITVVGNKIFASKINSQDLDVDQGKIDWRQGYEHGLKFEQFTLPEIISEKCVNYLKRMGLNFGCFDFIVNPDNEYIFLECNPNGQWLWIELETGMKISQAIAEELINHT
jgi:glutathione synthase/RimK-type ligase-like ATP-grasp enzyme